MKPHNNIVYLQHVLDAIGKIELYLTHHDKDTFWGTSLVQDGVIRQLTIIGEAVKQLSPEFRQQYPDIPWRDIAGMRDRLVHDYLGVDIEEVWLTTQDDLPTLKAEIIQIIDDTSS